MHRGLTRMLAMLVLMPFILLSLIAQGNMLARDPVSQRVVMVLCGSSLPVSMMIDDQGALVPAPPDPAPSHDAKPACGWAIHGQPALILSAAPQPPVAAAAYSADLPPAVRQYLRRVTAPAFLARAPPDMI